MESEDKDRKTSICNRRAETPREKGKPPKAGSGKSPLWKSKTVTERGVKGATEENQMATEHKETMALVPKASTPEEARINQSSRHRRI